MNVIEKKEKINNLLAVSLHKLHYLTLKRPSVRKFNKGGPLDVSFPFIRSCIDYYVEVCIVQHSVYGK